ncbi:MAG TPA: carbon storage regulator [Ktedonobacteraceae bacterium]|nr:carbon storage regulator [Ktedonobacteraceae bacterium]
MGVSANEAERANGPGNDWRTAMLILARYLDESLLIGEARVTILGIVRRKHGRIRIKLGIDAPPSIPILRAELPRFEREAQANISPSLETARGQQEPAHKESYA